MTVVTTMVGWLDGQDAARLTHAELEDRLQTEGRELLRVMLSDHLEVRAQREPVLAEVVDAQGQARPRVEKNRVRELATVFGEVPVRRVAYRGRGLADLHPADAALNLPVERHWHGLRRLAAIETARGSYDETVSAIERNTGQRLGKRQVEGLASKAAADFDRFYAERSRQPSQAGDALMLSFDGKAVVMRPESLRKGTARAARSANHKLATRLSKGEKRNRKRMAEVGAVFDITPAPRPPATSCPHPTTPLHAPRDRPPGANGSPPAWPPTPLT